MMEDLNWNFLDDTEKELATRREARRQGAFSCSLEESSKGWRRNYRYVLRMTGSEFISQKGSQRKFGKIS
jgi:hypothetical protein